MPRHVPRAGETRPPTGGEKQEPEPEQHAPAELLSQIKTHDHSLVHKPTSASVNFLEASSDVMLNSKRKKLSKSKLQRSQSSVGWGRLKVNSRHSTAVRAKIHAEAMKMTLHDEDIEKEVNIAINTLLKKAQASEGEITGLLQGLARLYRGGLVGLDYKFKSKPSLFRKVMSDHDENRKEASLTGTEASSPASVVENIKDALRYTIIFDTDTYTKGTLGVLEHISHRDDGMKVNRTKNFWGPDDGYQGINSTFKAGCGLYFEVQFHTPESIAVKEHECHVSYEKFRTAASTDLSLKMQLWEEMVSLWDMVPVPEGVLDIPHLEVQTLKLDLSALNEEEKNSIKHRKRLEAEVQYPISELHRRALKAEPEISALLRYLMQKHGPANMISLKDINRPVHGTLSIVRTVSIVCACASWCMYT